MLRTNQSFLAYISKLFDHPDRVNEITVRTFRRGERILKQGEQSFKVMLIKDGVSKCFFTEENDKEYIVEFLGSGEIIGEIEAIRKIPCLCNVEAITDVDVYSFSNTYFYKLLKTDLALNHLLITAFAERIINTSSRASFQQLYTLEHSLSKLKELQAKQGLTLSKEDMASYLGITVRSLNRALDNLKQ